MRITNEELQGSHLWGVLTADGLNVLKRVSKLLWALCHPVRRPRVVVVNQVNLYLVDSSTTVVIMENTGTIQNS
ncbi:hypothetical protein SAMN04487850_1163 [Prevotella aff. ruminicola Tc2-24]|uniref:Uncharacterized protein n=1 Tax=Prevotella aff. ruminicola Tc2-24 TaxID=81582 RepID=A0A1I0NE16_9BACT|nr:hypothetical protein [Prevotella aff. ruminicola Tc2-24]SEV99437.1 hypothetical protein SAMN04487850_1163 [Prevotella aff. ruminicola Tc2-24]